MIYSIYSSSNCEESFILEEAKPLPRPIVSFWCDDCNKKHEFRLEGCVDSIENLWEWIETEENEQEFD